MKYCALLSLVAGQVARPGPCQGLENSFVHFDEASSFNSELE